jgi:hypothetical protein
MVFQVHERCRNDVERAFGMLQQRFAIVWYPSLQWSTTQMWEFMNSCVIMHNMIIESARANPMHDDLPYDWEGPFAQVDNEVPAEFETFPQNHREIRDQDTHQRLQDDLVTHL